MNTVLFIILYFALAGCLLAVYNLYKQFESIQETIYMIIDKLYELDLYEE